MLNKTAKNISIIATGAIVMAVTLAIFFATQWGGGEVCSRIDIVSMVFVLLSEFTLFSGVLIMSDMARAYPNHAFIWSGFTGSLVIYFMVTVGMAYIRENYFSDIKKFTLQEIIALAVLAVILIALYMAAEKVNQSDNALLSKREFMQDIENRFFTMKTDANNSVCQKELDELYEAVKCCDKYKVCRLDDRICDCVDDLEITLSKADEAEMKEAAAPHLEKLKHLFQQRAALVAEHARGGF